MMKDESYDRDMFQLDPFLNGVSLVVGKPISGKSLFLKFLAENTVRSQHSVGVLDPNGDHTDLNIVGLDVFGEANALPDLPRLQQLLREIRTGFVLDLSGLGRIEKNDYLNSALDVILPFHNETGQPALFIVDEAHDLSRLNQDVPMFKDLKGFCLSSFLPGGISTPIINSVTNFVVNRTSTDEIRKLQSRVRNPAIIDICLEAILRLSPEDAFAIISEGLENPVTIQFSTIIQHLKSPHLRQKNMFWNGFLPKENCFYFVESDTNQVVQVNNLRELCRTVEIVSGISLIRHLLNNDLSRWAENVIGDQELAHQFAMIEHGADISLVGQIRTSICSAIQSRYAPLH